MRGWHSTIEKKTRPLYKNPHFAKRSTPPLSGMTELAITVSADVGMTLPGFLGMPRISTISCHIQALSATPGTLNSSAEALAFLAAGAGSIQLQALTTFVASGSINIGGSATLAIRPFYRLVVLARQPQISGQDKLYVWHQQTFTAQTDSASGTVAFTAAEAQTATASSGTFSSMLYQFRRLARPTTGGASAFVKQCEDNFTLNLDNAVHSKEITNATLSACAERCADESELCAFFDYNDAAKTCKLYQATGLDVSSLSTSEVTTTGNRRSCWAQKGLVDASSGEIECDSLSRDGFVNYTTTDRGCEANVQPCAGTNYRDATLACVPKLANNVLCNTEANCKRVCASGVGYSTSGGWKCGAPCTSTQYRNPSNNCVDKLGAGVPCGANAAECAIKCRAPMKGVQHGSTWKCGVQCYRPDRNDSSDQGDYGPHRYTSKLNGRCWDHGWDDQYKKHVFLLAHKCTFRNQVNTSECTNTSDKCGSNSQANGYHQHGHQVPVP